MQVLHFALRFSLPRFTVIRRFALGKLQSSGMRLQTPHNIWRTPHEGSEESPRRICGFEVSPCLMPLSCEVDSMNRWDSSPRLENHWFCCDYDWLLESCWISILRKYARTFCNIGKLLCGYAVQIIH